MSMSLPGVHTIIANNLQKFLKGKRSLICRSRVLAQLMYQDNTSVCFIPPCTSLLYSKTGVYRGIHYFLIFALKHILWVLVRTASIRPF